MLVNLFKGFRTPWIERRRRRHAYGLIGFFLFNNSTTESVPKRILPNVRDRNSNWLIGSPWYPKVYKKLIVDATITNIKSNFLIIQI